MTSRNTEPSQGDGPVGLACGGSKNDSGQQPASAGSLGAPEHQRSGGGNKVFKSGPLFISSRGIGWTSWKKRWFILTRTSLVFFRSDPSVVPQKDSEVNLTLGGIDLNNSGSVDVKADKKLLTVLFPDGRDGRAFTLKAETLEDLYEWKTALEEALAQAPSSTLVMGQTGMLKNEKADAADDSVEQSKDRQPVKSLVIGRPILLALEDIDGTPSFLEKALRFIEDHGVKVEGILRQAADVEAVEHRIHEYEQGKCEFSPEEDAHVVADCVKYVIRELPSPPVPASCCNALVDACRTDRGMRVNAMRTAICETFPEPNRRLLQRILMMMQAVASHKAVNRMSSSAVAACMAPLLLRPLLAGDCELDNDFDMGGDSSVQLLQAAAAANHAQAICITLLEEYDDIFGEGSMSPEPYSDSEVSGSEGEEISDYDESYDGDDFTEGSDAEADEDFEQASNGTCSEAGDTDQNDYKNSKQERSLIHNLDDKTPVIQKSATISNGSCSVSRQTAWGRSAAKKNLSLESIDLPSDDEEEIQRLEATKTDLQNRIAEEVKGNVLLHESLEKRKKALLERRLALEQDVARLQDQLQKEKELRRVLEAGLKMSDGTSPVSSTIDEKTKAELKEIGQAETDVTNLKQKVDDLQVQLSQQREQKHGSVQDSYSQPRETPNYQAKLKDKENNIEITDAESFTRSKDNHVDKSGGAKEMKHEPAYSNEQLDPVHDSKSAGAPTIAPTLSKKYGTKSEGTNSTSSALSKLTTRLTFLKERRSQITNELQNLDKGRNSNQPVHNLERGRSFDGSQSLQNTEQQAAPDSQLTQNMETVRSGGQPLMPPRTLSR